MVSLLIISSALMIVMIVNSFVIGEKSQVETEPGNFTCHAGSEYEFVFPVNVNLSDGMNANEAKTVARCLYEVNTNQTNYKIKDVQNNSDGTWTVYLLWGIVSRNGERENYDHYYNVQINAIDRTVEYDRCR